MKRFIFGCVVLQFICWSLALNDNKEIQVSLKKCPGSVFEEKFVQIPAHLVFTKENITFGIGDHASRAWCHVQDVLEYTLDIVEVLPEPETYYVTESTVPQNSNETVDYEANSYYEDDLPPPMQKYFVRNGFLRIDRDYYRPHEFCLKGINESSGISVEVCRRNCSLASKYAPCLRKCCSLGTSLNVLSERCSPTGPAEWSPFYYRDPYTILKGEEQRRFQPHLIQSPPSCMEEQHQLTNRNLQNVTKQPWRLLKDGSIWYIAGNRKWTKLVTDNYCVDGILNYGDGEFYTGLPADQTLLICPRDENRSSEGKYSPLYVTVMLISSIFLFLTAAVYISLWDRQNNIHTWTVLSQVISMFFMYVFLAVANILGLTIDHESAGGFCAAVGILAHFFFLATFCWLTMINFDLCYTFRNLSPGSGHSRGLKRFLCYFAFATTVPVSVVTIGIVLEQMYRDDFENQVITPLYGQITCYIAVWAQGVYVYYIVGTLLSCNIILILVTFVTLYRIRQSTNVVVKSRANCQHQSFKICLKLFIVMGVSWIFEIISWASVFEADRDRAPWYWVIFDLINILQAVAIFIIFVCKPRTLNQLQQKYPCLRGILSPLIAKLTTSAPAQARHDQHTTGTTISGPSSKVRQASKESIGIGVNLKVESKL